MTFAHGREPFPTSPDKNSGRDVASSGRPSQGDESLPEPNLPNEADLAQMRDDGWASAAAMWAEVRRIGLEVMAGGTAKQEPDPTITHEEGSAVASALLDVDAAIRKAALALKLEGNIDVHLIFEGMLTGCADAGSRVADRWES